MAKSIDATNDYLIEELINNPNYKIFKDKILTRITKTGKVSVDGIWREKAILDSRCGYKCISYNKKKLRLHRVLYAKFIGKLDKKMVINHKDGNRKNNKLSNLEMVSQSENCLNRKYVIGYHKIDFKMAEKIRQEYEKGNTSYKKLAKKYNLAKSTLHYVIKRKTWQEDVNYSKAGKIDRSTPNWVSRKELKRIKENCPKGKELDHIIPLNHPDVCGLNVPWNIQYLTPEENLKKGNHFDFTSKNNSWRKK